jgi:hypothetical protein
LNNFNKLETSQLIQNYSILSTSNANTYNLTKILHKKNKSKPIVIILELQSEIKTLKSELQTLTQAQQKDSLILQHLLTKLERQSDSEPQSEEQTLETHAVDHALSNIEHIPEDYLNVLTQITSKTIFNKKYFSFFRRLQVRNYCLV